MFEGIDFMSEESRRFAEIWRDLPRQELLPSRRDFDPAQIAGMLPGVSMYELRSREEIVIRLAGTRLVDFYGREVTGMNYLDLWPEERRKTASTVLHLMVEQPCGLLVGLNGITKQGVMGSRVSVGFPFLSREGKANLLLFHTSAFELPPAHDFAADPIVQLRVNRRVFIDIGAGVPDFREAPDD